MYGIYWYLTDVQELRESLWPIFEFGWYLNFAHIRIWWHSNLAYIRIWTIFEFSSRVYVIICVKINSFNLALFLHWSFVYCIIWYCKKDWNNLRRCIDGKNNKNKHWIRKSFISGVKRAYFFWKPIKRIFLWSNT